MASNDYNSPSLLLRNQLNLHLLRAVGSLSLRGEGSVKKLLFAFNIQIWFIMYLMIILLFRHVVQFGLKLTKIGLARKGFAIKAKEWRIFFLLFMLTSSNVLISRSCFAFNTIVFPHSTNHIDDW